MIPIDHGLCFPDCFEICNYEIVWMDWPQVKEPFSKKTMEYIDSLNPKNDVEMLCTKLSLRKKCLQNFYLAEILIKNSAKKGFTLYDIGNMIYKNDEDDEKETDIQHLIEQTKDIYKIVKSTKNNKNLDKWVRNSISVMKKNNSKKQTKQPMQSFNKAFDEPIREEEFEEEVKRNPEDQKRRRSFSDNISLIEEESILKSSKPKTLKFNNILQSPGSISNSTEDDLNLIEPLHVAKKLSTKFQNNEVKLTKSPENLTMKKCLSLPYLKRSDSKLSKSSDEYDIDKEKNFVLEKGKLKTGKWKKKKEKKLKAEDIYDDIFIHYFENFLNLMLDRKLNEKNRAKNLYRNRVVSTQEGSLKN